MPKGGGYYQIPWDFIEYSIFSIPIYFQNSSREIVSKAELEQSLALYVQDNIENCVDLSIFQNQGFQFERKEPLVTAQIHSGKVLYHLSYPLAIRKGQRSAQIETFQGEVNFDFSAIFSILTQLKEEQLITPDAIAFTALLDLAETYGFTLEISQLSEEDVILYSLIFDKTALPIQPYIFSFAADFDWSEFKAVSTPEEESLTEFSSESVNLEKANAVKTSLNILKHYWVITELPTESVSFAGLGYLGEVSHFDLDPVSPSIDWSQADSDPLFNYEQALLTDPLQGFQVSSARAWQTISNNPQILVDNSLLLDTVFQRQDYLRAVEILNNNPSLLTDALIFNQIDRKARQSIDVLNNYPNVLTRFFEKNSISIDDGLQLAEYDGIMVKTKGTGATEFNPTHYPLARVLKTGELIDANGAKISRAKIELDPNLNAVRVTGGVLDLSNSIKGDYVTTGDIQLHGSRIFSQHLEERPENLELVVGFTEGSPRFLGRTGSKILLETPDQKFVTFSGDAFGGADFIVDKEDIIVNPGTRMDYPLSLKGQSLVLAAAIEPVVFGTCREGLSCVSSREELEGNKKINELRIISRNGGKLTVETSESAFDRFQVEGIPAGDYSTTKLVLKKKNQNLAVMQFSDGNKMTQKNIAGLKTEIDHNYLEEGKLVTVKLAGGRISKCSDGVCQDFGKMPDLTDRLYLRFDSPTVTVNGVKVSSGLPKRPMLNQEWYNAMLPAVVEKGIDPYFFIATNILEIGGVRASGFEQKIASDAVSRELTEKGLGTGANFVRRHGAGGVIVGDFDNAVKKGHFTEQEVQDWVMAMAKAGINANYNKKLTYDLDSKFDSAVNVVGLPSSQSEQGIWESSSKLNQVSLILLKTHQDRVLRIANEVGGSKNRKITMGLQSFNGLGTLPRVFNENGRLVQLQADGSIVPTKGSSKGFTGQQYPLYGESLKKLMVQLSKDKRVKALVDSSLLGQTASTPVLSRITG